MNQEYEELKQVILEAIEAEMERRNLSQAQLGELCGLKRHKVNGILRGTEKAVSFKKLVEIANSIDLEVDVKVKRVRNK